MRKKVSNHEKEEWQIAAERASTQTRATL